MMLLSIIPSQPTSAGYIIAGVIALLPVMCVWKARKYPHKLSNGIIFLALLLCLLTYLFPMGGTDFYGYKNWVETVGYTDISTISRYYLHFEKPYYVIVNIVQNNYLLFRLVVWGGSLILYWQTAKRLGVDKSTFTFYLCICIVQLTAVSRVCLAYAIAFFGFSFLVKPITKKGSNLLSFVLGALLIVLSLSFHKSAVFLLAVLPLSLLTFNKKTIWLFALAIPALIIAVKANLFDFVSNFDQSEDSLLDSQTAMYYLDNDKKRVIGIGQGIELFMKYGSHIVIIFLIAKSIINRAYETWPKYVQKYGNATLFITVLSMTLLFVADASTYKIFERFIAFAYVPQSYFMAHILKFDYDKKTVSLFNLLLTGYVVYGLLYYNFYFGINNF